MLYQINCVNKIHHSIAVYIIYLMNFHVSLINTFTSKPINEFNLKKFSSVFVSVREKRFVRYFFFLLKKRPRFLQLRCLLFIRGLLLLFNLVDRTFFCFFLGINMIDTWSLRELYGKNCDY